MSANDDAVRIIFSRKGFDSRYGGGSSPVLSDGTMISLPIPEAGSGIRYSEIRTPRGPMLDLMRELGIARVRENEYRPLDERTEAHLDPDLYSGALQRHSDWRPVFGQSSAAQGHLSNNGVRAGDLFVFLRNVPENGRNRWTTQIRWPAIPCHLRLHAHRQHCPCNQLD